MEAIRGWLLDLVRSASARGLSVSAAPVLVALLCLCYILLLLRPSPKLPPGPAFAFPLIGHLHLLGLQPHRSLARMGHRFGPLFSLKIGSIPIVVASTPEAARQILRTHDQTFAYRPRTASVDNVLGSSPGFLMSQPGPYMRFIRYLCATELFSVHRLEHFKPIRDEEVRALLQSVYADDNTISTSHTESSITSQASGLAAATGRRLIHLRPRLQRTGNNIVSRMAIGETISGTTLQPLLAAAEAIVTMNVGDYLPWIQWADLQGCVKKSKRAGLTLRSALQWTIEQRREQRKGVYEPPADILDILLSTSLTCPKDLELTDDHIRAILFDVIAGGSDTFGAVIEWVMTELLANPIQMKKTQEEIDNVMAGKQGDEKKRMVEEADIQKMPFLQAVVKETMRLHPIVPLLIPREARSACQVMGFDIPVKAQAFINVWAIGRDPTVWKNPTDFQPQRFLDCNINGRGQHFEFLPFGSGRRACPGLNLGLVAVHTILAGLLHAFSWTPHDTGHDMTEKFGMLLTKKVPLLAIAAPKLPSQFYD